MNSGNEDGWMNPKYSCLAKSGKPGVAMCHLSGGHAGPHYAYAGVFGDYKWPRKGQSWPDDNGHTGSMVFLLGIMILLGIFFLVASLRLL